jgi:hypothetical protein
VTAFLFGIASWIYPGRDGLLGIDRGCQRNASGCNVLVEMLGTIAAIAVAFVYFTSWRVKRVIRPHLADASDKPWALVPTASEIEDVVGRDGLCEIIEKDLAETKRPQAIVAGVGDGKTAALVKLTQYLFERGAVPVPIELRKARRVLDFRDLARDRFLERVGPSLLSDDEGDKVWRELCADRLVVILADGLEEALPHVSGTERAKSIQLALDKVNDDDMPLVIATRPHAALQEIDVAVIRLEPLPTRDVIRYIATARRDGSTAGVAALARTAEVMERPLYLRLARELHRVQGLSGIPLANRVRTRCELLKSWHKLLMQRAEHGGVRVRREDRVGALETAEQMACVALAHNTLDVAFYELIQADYVPTKAADLPKTQVFAGHAERLELVESIKNGVRFRHSIMQAYLGARRLPELVHGTYLDDALKDPGRELLMALVMSCLMDGDSPRPEDLRDRLRTAAEGAKDHTSFELLAAAYEIHALADRVDGEELGKATVRVWDRHREESSGLELIEAKLRAVLPIAEAGGAGDAAAYAALWEICQVEDCYAVRFQAAQELAGAGQAAFAVMPAKIESALSRASQVLAYRDGQPPEADWKDVRRCSLLGWTMPLLAVTCGEPGATSMQEAIAAWVELAANGTEERPGVHLGVEAALAQGFKWEANRMPGGAGADGRALLIDHALGLLEATRWWQTEVAVLQALALWALDDDQPRRSDIRKTIRTYRGRRHHPFVRRVASECLSAVGIGSDTAVSNRPRKPSRFMWIDDTGVAAKIGPEELPADRVTRLWIPPAAGWHALAPGVRQLVGDILVLTNLVEGASAAPGAPDAARTARVRDREAKRLGAYRQGSGLPVCVTDPAARARLAVDRAEDEDRPSCAELGCPFGLCPYPTRDERPFRGELPEIFCREQQRRLRGRDARLPRWIDGVYIRGGPAFGQPVIDLKGFWEKMERRDQG